MCSLIGKNDHKIQIDFDKYHVFIDECLNLADILLLFGD